MDNGERPGDDLVDIEPSRIEVDGVRGRFEGGVLTGGVTLIAGSEIGKDGGFVGLEAALLEFKPAAMGALFGGRGEEDLHLGLWEDDGLSVAAFHHHTPLASHLLLERDEATSDGRKGRKFRGELADFRRANIAGDISPIHRHLVRPIGSGTEIDPCASKQLDDGI
jgi:hypothetical protein